MKSVQDQRVVIIGGGFTGLSAAHELSRRNVPVTVLESAGELGGLAGAFPVGSTRLERFYHHWFASDRHIMELIGDLNLKESVRLRSTVTGMYYANKLYRLTSPLDVLRFTPLPFLDRVRLGLLVLKAHHEKNWTKLDDISARDWLKRLAGETVYSVVWEPLLKGKFGEFANDVSAAWFWAKLVLRGGSRNKGGSEVLAYFQGGFAALADRIAAAITAKGGEIRVNTAATGLMVRNGAVEGVWTGGELVPCTHAIMTPALPIVADLMEPFVEPNYVARLRKVKYLANVCLILILDRSLSGLYWMNVNDPSFPFVGIIEHTNFEPTESYQGRHIVYLSKYIPETAEIYCMTDGEVLAYALPHIKRMFPNFREEWIEAHHVWRAQYAQPVTTTGYRHLIPDVKTPIEGLYLSTMAQIYPEDRGTNYAVREGKRVADMILRQA